MEEIVFEYEHNPISSASVTILQLPQEQNTNNISPAPPLLSLEFHLTTHDLHYYRPPHDLPEQLQYVLIHAKLLRLKLDPSVYMSYDTFHDVMQRNLENWGEEFENNYRHIIVHDMIMKVAEIVGDKSNKGRYVVEMFVRVSLCIDHYVDRRVSSEELLRLNAVLHASTSSMLQLLKRMKVDENVVNDNCGVCFKELRKGRELLRMPCSHLFHGDCVMPWLKENHSCPICRYELIMKEAQS